MEWKKGGLYFTATDLDLRIRGFCVPADAELVGVAPDIAPPFTKLFEVVRELSGPTLELEWSAKGKEPAKELLIRSGMSLFKLPLLFDAKEFPPEGDMKDAASVKIPCSVLLAGLKGVSRFQSTSAERYVLNGVYVSLDREIATLVATDGRRLAWTRFAVEGGPAEKAGFILPSSAVAVVERLANVDEKVTLDWSQFAACFSVGQFRFQTKLVDGDFPNWRAVLPDEDQITRRLELPKERFAKLIRLAAIMTAEKTNSVRLRLEKSRLIAEAASPEVGAASDYMEVAYDGEPLEIRFDPDYLLSAVASAGGDTLRLNLVNDTAPGLFRAAEGWECVVMPMRMT